MLSAFSNRARLGFAVSALVSAWGLVGCGAMVSPADQSYALPGRTITGNVHGGVFPIQSATIRLMGDAQDLQGHVESIAAGVADTQVSNTGNLLPNVESTFSWVRLAQRIPVRIHIDTVPSTVELALGMTATVSVGPAATPASSHGLLSRVFTQVER